MADRGEGLVLVNGSATSVQGPRARALFGDSARVVYKDRGRVGSIRGIWSALASHRGGWIYCIDLGIPSSLLAALRRRWGRSVRLIYEIGDPGGPLMRTQARTWVEVAAAEWVDRNLPARADRLVFRGSYLADYFAAVSPDRPLPPWLWLPDGADMGLFTPMRPDARVAGLRRRHGLEASFVVGLVGNIHLNARHGIFYGWDLAEALARLPDDPARPVVGIVVGDGPGRGALEAARDRLGLGDRLRVVGRVAHDEVPLWINAFDVGLSTQTDDPVGWGRTTAKLPEYLGCGTVVVCTDVGEAHRWLSGSGQTLPYRGIRDEGYPARLAGKIRELAGSDLEPLRRANRDLALRLFDYEVLRPRASAFVAGDPVVGAEVD